MKPREDIHNIVMYKTSWCPDCIRAENFFSEYNITVNKINIDKDSSAADKVVEINNGNRSVPTIIISLNNGEKITLVEPNRPELETYFLEAENGKGKK